MTKAMLGRENVGKEVRLGRRTVLAAGLLLVFTACAGVIESTGAPPRFPTTSSAPATTSSEAFEVTTTTFVEPASTTTPVAAPPTTTTEPAPPTTTTTEPAITTTTTTLTGGVAGPTCVNGWITPARGTDLRTFPLDLIREHIGLGTGDLFVIEDMRYFLGPPDVEQIEPRGDVERWYVEAFLESDPSVAGRWIVGRVEVGAGVHAEAAAGTTGFEPGTWVAHEDYGEARDPFWLGPCLSDRGPFCTCDWGVSGCSCTDTDEPICSGPPAEVMGCLEGR